MIDVRYDDIFTFSNLYKAYEKCCKGRKYKASKIRFEKDISNNLIRLYENLRKRTYRMTSYHTYTIYEPKEREINCIEFRDKIVQRLLCDHVWNDYLVTHSIYDSCAIQKGKGITFAIERVKHHMRSHVQQFGVTGYVCKLDIKEYYKNIKQDVLIEYMNKHIVDEDLCHLMNHIVTSYKQGLPIGNQCSQILANLYLDSLDHYIKEYWRIKGYVRYLDDMILLHVSKQYLQNVMYDLMHFIKPYGLTFNERKSHIYPITQGCDFIGWHFKVLPSKRIHMRLRKQSIKNIKRRIKTMNHDLKHGRLQLNKYTLCTQVQQKSKRNMCLFKTGKYKWTEKKAHDEYRSKQERGKRQ